MRFEGEIWYGGRVTKVDLSAGGVTAPPRGKVTIKYDDNTTESSK